MLAISGVLALSQPVAIFLIPNQWKEKSALSHQGCTPKELILQSMLAKIHDAAAIATVICAQIPDVG